MSDREVLLSATSRLCTVAVTSLKLDAECLRNGEVGLSAMKDVEVACSV